MSDKADTNSSGISMDNAIHFPIGVKVQLLEPMEVLTVPVPDSTLLELYKRSRKSGMSVESIASVLLREAVENSRSKS